MTRSPAWRITQVPTPIAERQDALLAASHLTIAVREVVASEPGRQVALWGESR